MTKNRNRNRGWFCKDPDSESRSRKSFDVWIFGVGIGVPNSSDLSEILFLNTTIFRGSSSPQIPNLSMFRGESPSPRPSLSWRLSMPRAKARSRFCDRRWGDSDWPKALMPFYRRISLEIQNPEFTGSTTGRLCKFPDQEYQRLTKARWLFSRFRWSLLKKPASTLWLLRTDLER